MDNRQIVLRPSTAADEPFVKDLIFETMHSYVEDTWPNDPEAHRHYYEINKFVPSNTRIIELAGKAVGQLTTTLRADCLFIDELHILPEYQRQGIGGWAIEQVFKEARGRELPVRLTVLTVNREAQSLYLKMGFTVIAEKEYRFHMEYSTR